MAIKKNPFFNFGTSNTANQTMLGVQQPKPPMSLPSTKPIPGQVPNVANKYSPGGYGTNPQYINPQDFSETLRKVQYNEPLAIPTGEKNRVYQNYQNLLNLKAPTVDPYKSKYTGKIDNVLNDLLNAKFDYNIDTDPLYDQYKRMYNREGDRAYENTLGEASGLTGGRTNTFAMSAAQQAQNYYSTQLNDKVPELYQMAYARHMQELDNKRSNIGTMSGLDQVDYGRYMDKVNYDRNVYENDRGYYTDNLYRDYEKNYNAYIDDRNFNYGVERDKVGDEQWKMGFDRNVFESDRSYDRGVFESDRSYDRGVLESDRNYNRGVFESDRNYGLSAAKFSYQKQQDKLDREAKEAAADGKDVNADELRVIWSTIVNDKDPEAALKEYAMDMTDDETDIIIKRLRDMGIIKTKSPIDDLIAGMAYQTK